MYSGARTHRGGERQAPFPPGSLSVAAADGQDWGPSLEIAFPLLEPPDQRECR